MGPCWDQSPWRQDSCVNSAGVKPDVCDALQRIAQASDPSARVWRGSELPPTMQGMKVLGTPLGHREYVATYLDGMRPEIPSVPDVQCAWLLLLHCASARANYLLRVVRPVWVQSFACAHDQNMWKCLRAILRIPVGSCEEQARSTATLPLSLGGLGLRSAQRTCVAAHWGQLGRCTSNDSGATPHSGGPDRAPSGRCSGVAMFGFRKQSRCQFGRSSRLGGAFMVSFSRRVEAGSAGARSARTCVFSAGLAALSGQSVEEEFREALFPDLSPSRQALLLSQSGPRAGAAFSVTPSSMLARIEPPLFRVMLQRRLHLPVPLSNRICGCGRPLDYYGHHRAACGRTGVLGRRGFPLESAAARICREGGCSGGAQHVGPQHGCGRSCGCRCSTSGLGRRWIANVGWRPIGNRHYTGVCFARRWEPETRSVRARWCGLDRSKKGQGEGFTPNWSGLERERAWLSWHWRWGCRWSAEATDLRVSTSQKPRPAVNLFWCAPTHGAGVAVAMDTSLDLCSGALLRCFLVGSRWGVVTQMVLLQGHTRSSVTTASLP